MSELASQPISIQSLYAWYRENKLFVNRRYQRKLVWTLQEKQKLIESILKKYPIPAILVAEREDQPGTYEIIDGLQRLHTIVSFIETSFETLDRKTFSLNFFPTAQSRADEGLFVPNEGDLYLSQREVTAILDYTIALSVMRNSTETEINDVFSRINTYGHRLSDQERRQAGVQNDYSDMVRVIACTLRGDASGDVLALGSMPSISIDLPKSKHGYQIQANDVVWVSEGILRSTDLRDSMDEQCIADIAACIVGGSLIERSKDALDEIYTVDSHACTRILSALGVYGRSKFTEELKFCFDVILNICSGDGEKTKLRDIVFSNNTTNAFPSVFAVLLIAIHELTIQEIKKPYDYAGLKKSIKDINSRFNTTRSASLAIERRKNIDVAKGLMRDFFIDADISKDIYGNHSTTDIDSIIRRSEIELSDYELKQGILQLHSNRPIDNSIFDKVIHTICAIANNGPKKSGKIIIGIADKDVDADRIKELDNITPKPIGKRYIVGISREAKKLGISTEEYVTMWRDKIRESELSIPLRDSILSNIDFNSYFDLGLLVLTITPQKEISYVGDQVYWRENDSTKLAIGPKQIVGISNRF